MGLAKIEYFLAVAGSLGSMSSCGTLYNGGSSASSSVMTW